MGAYMANRKKKVCTVCNVEKCITTYRKNEDICRSCKANQKREAGAVNCKFCGQEIKNKKGLICQLCKNQKNNEYYKNLVARRAGKDYSVKEEELLKQFLVAWKRKSRAEHECIYMDYKKHIRKSNQSNSAIEIMKKYITEWERKPKSRERFENMYHEFRLFLCLPERTS